MDFGAFSVSGALLPRPGRVIPRPNTMVAAAVIQVTLPGQVNIYVRATLTTHRLADGENE